MSNYNLRLQQFWTRLISELEAAKRDKKLADVAKRSGLHVQTLYKYLKGERGKAVSYNSVNKLAKGLGYTDRQIKTELYGDERYAFLSDICPEILDEVYDAIHKKEIDKDRLHTMIKLLLNKE